MPIADYAYIVVKPARHASSASPLSNHYMALNIIIIIHHSSSSSSLKSSLNGKNEQQWHMIFVYSSHLTLSQDI